MLTSDEFVLTVRVYCLPDNFCDHRSRIKTASVMIETDAPMHACEHNCIICLMLCYTYGTDKKTKE